MPRNYDDNSFIAELLERPDDHVVTEDLDTPAVFPETSYLVDDIYEFEDLLRSFATKAPNLTIGTILKKVEHEHSHGIAAHMAGFTIVQYGLVYSPHEYGGINWAVHTTPLKPSRDVTKLSMASVIAAPKYLSGPDKRQLDMLGYKSPWEIAKKVVAHNNANPTTPLKIPESIYNRFHSL